MSSLKGMYMYIICYHQIRDTHEHIHFAKTKLVLSAELESQIKL